MPNQEIIERLELAKEENDKGLRLNEGALGRVRDEVRSKEQEAQRLEDIIREQKEASSYLEKQIRKNKG
jgi:septal ring factor EnvC (AmiA/AmiB activator)